MFLTSSRILSRSASLLTVLLTAHALAETLPNGIRLPESWPPRTALLPDTLPTPPYLVNRRVRVVRSMRKSSTSSCRPRSSGMTAGGVIVLEMMTEVGLVKVFSD